MIDAAGALGRIDAGAPEAERDIVADRQPGEAGIFLEDDAHPVRHPALHRRAFEGHVPRAWRRQAGDDA